MRSPRFRRLGVYLVVFLSIALTAGAGGAVALPGNGLIGFTRDGDVWVVEPDGSNAVNLTQGRVGFPQAVAWSTDGAWLAVQGLAGASPTSVFLMRADGSEFARVTTGSANAFLGCWLSPTRLVVRGQRQLTGGLLEDDLFVVRPDGTVVDRLTSDGGAKQVSTSSCASATGSVFYLRRDSAGLGAWRVAPGGGPVRVAFEGVGVPAQAPVPSADGSMVAVVDGNGVAVAGEGGGSATRISTTAPVASDIAWSPDGERLTFVHAIQGACDRFSCVYTFDVHGLATDGSGERELTSRYGASAGTVRLSPDGERTLFTTGGFLRVMNPDGTCETRLLDQPTFPPEATAWQPVEGSRSQPLAPISCTDLGVRAEGPPRVAAGGTATFRFTVANDGTETATDASASVFIEGVGVAAVSIAASQGSCSLETVTCRLGPIAARAGAVVTVVVRSMVEPAESLSDLNEGWGAFTLSATVAAAEPDLNDDNTATTAIAAVRCSEAGTDGNDEIRGSNGDDVLCAFSGDDRVVALGGRDVLTGGPGNDDLDGGSGSDEIIGEGFDDRIDAGGGNDFVDAGSGRDRIVGGRGRDRLHGGGDRDRIDGGPGGDRIDGGGSNDRLTGGPGRDRIQAGYGYDVVLARDGERDRITCGGRFDTVYADRKDRIGGDCELVRRKR